MACSGREADGQSLPCSRPDKRLRDNGGAISGLFDGVNVNAVAQHLALTPGTGDDPDPLTRSGSTLPARRYALPTEVAYAAVDLASTETDYVHGITLPVDGGHLAR